MPYAIEHNGKAYMPGPLRDDEGKAVDVVEAFGSVDAYNAAIEAAELKWLTDNRPDRFVAYMGGCFDRGTDLKVTTWRGRKISSHVYVWNKRRNPRMSYTSNYIWSVNVLTTWGDWYCGTSLGAGIYVKLRKMKNAPR